MIKIAISGPGESGKDIIGNWFRDNTFLRYTSGTSLYAAEIVFDRWGRAAEYKSVQECWEDRRNHRQTWARIIGEYNMHDPVQLYRDCLAKQDILTGIRWRHEFEAIRAAKLVDLWVWIDRPGVPHDPTMEYGASDCDVSIVNGGSEQELFAKLAIIWIFIEKVQFADRFRGLHLDKMVSQNQAMGLYNT